MNKREYAKLKKWTDTLTDEQLKEEYYDAVFKTLGSQAEEMYERGYDIADIHEKEFSDWEFIRMGHKDIVPDSVDINNDRIL